MLDWGGYQKVFIRLGLVGSVRLTNALNATIKAN
jgi:hypothetical protein